MLILNDFNPWNENSTKNDKLELLILNDFNPWNENSTKNDKLELLRSHY